MANASATVMAGFRLSDLCQVVDTVKKIQKYNEDTGKPYFKEEVQTALHVVGKPVPDPDEPFPSEWKDLLGMEIVHTGDTDKDGHGLHGYKFDSFVAGFSLGCADYGYADIVVLSDVNMVLNKAEDAFRKLCEKLGVNRDAIQLAPQLYAVCYYSY